MLDSVTAFFITLLLIHILSPLARRLNLVDTPCGRKQHPRPVPLIGGVAMFLGFIFSLLMLDRSLAAFRCLIAGAGLLVITGVLDDFKEVSRLSRFVVQVFAGLLLCYWGGHRLVYLGNIFGLGDIYLHSLSVPLTVLATVALINAMNMIDGVDGLAGSLAMTQFILLASVAHLNTFIIEKELLALLVAVIIAFLLFNIPFKSWRSRQVFMGDAGSMFLGFVLVWFLLDFSQAPEAPARPVTMLWIVAVQLFDIVAVVLYRLSQRSSPATAGREHIHHLLMAQGIRPIGVLIILSVLSLLLGAFGIWGAHHGVADDMMFAGYLISFLLYLSMTYLLRKRTRRLVNAH